MTKDELIAALQSKFHIILDVMDVKVITPTLNFYRVKVFDLVNGGLRDQNISFYVENEGLATEAAYWAPSEPKPTPVENAQALLKAFLDSKITDATVRSYRIMEGTFNIETRTVVVEALKPDWLWAFFLITHDGLDFQIAPFA